MNAVRLRGKLELGILVSFDPREAISPSASATLNATEGLVIPLLQEMLATQDPDGFVARYGDIAIANLVCATGLPNSECIDLPKYLALLDRMATAVRQYTERSWRLFKVKPAEFQSSECVFRVLMMEHVLRVQFQVKYDPIVLEATANGGEWYTTNSSEVFIHGILDDKRMGTCSSLPVFSIAVGRRLGYPLKLVRVPNHCVFRWDDGHAMFNFQHTGAGTEIRDDEYFHSWPRKWTDLDHEFNARCKVWLHSMTPRQEISKFLCNRAMILCGTQRYAEGLQAIEAAERFDPGNPACADISFKLLEKMAGATPAPLLQCRGVPCRNDSQTK